MNTGIESLGMLTETREADLAQGATSRQDGEGDGFAGLLDLFHALFGAPVEVETAEGELTLPNPLGHAGVEMAFGMHLRAEHDPELEQMHFTLRAALASITQGETPAAAQDAELPAQPPAMAPALPLPREATPQPTLPVEMPMATPAPEARMAAPESPTPAAAPVENAAESTPAAGQPAPPVTNAQPAAAAPVMATSESPVPVNERAATPAPADDAAPEPSPPIARAGEMSADDGGTSNDTSRGNPGEAQARPMSPTPPAMETHGETFSVARVQAPQPTAPTTSTAPASAAAPQPEIPARVTWLAQEGGGTARIALHPQELGEVEVSVRVRGNSVDVQFVAEDPTAQLAVSSARESLLEALGARDLRMESFQVRGAEDAGSERDFADSRQRDDATTRDDASRDGSSERPNMEPAMPMAAGGEHVEQTHVDAGGATPTTPSSGIDVHV